MELINLIILESGVIVIFTIAHYLFIKTGGAIYKEEKGILGIAELCAIMILLSAVFIQNPSSKPIFMAAIILFPGLRWQRDYALNLMRGLPLGYVPDPTEQNQDRKTVSNTDEFLFHRKPETRVAIRAIALVLSILAAFIILNYGA